MSEKLPRSKAETGHEEFDSIRDTQAHNADHLQHEAESSEHNHSIDKIQESIHQEALSAKEITIDVAHQDKSHQPIFGIQRELKADAYKQTIQKVRSHLSPTERTLSKIIHHRTIEPVSELSSKTVARPSGVLGGGIVALIGSSIVLFMAKRYGFHYNFTIFLILLVGGFGAGLLVELCIRLVRRKT